MSDQLFLSYLTSYELAQPGQFIAGQITQEQLIGFLSSNRLLGRLDKIYLCTNFQTHSYHI